MIHGIVCSYLGDGELDIGKTARWLRGFTDTLFFYDLNYGEAARHYAVDYARTFPEAKFSYHDANLAGPYEDVAVFREEAFKAADKAWKYASTDWVIFVDASESLTVNVSYDNIEPPDPGELILNYLRDEAASASGSVVTFPYYIFLDQGDVVEEEMVVDPALYQSLIERQAILDTNAPSMEPEDVAEEQAEIDALTAANRAIYWTCSPRMQAEPPGRALNRMFKVSFARSGSIDWDSLDTFGAAASADACGIVSYAYARDVEPSTATTDVGFQNRLLVQQFRTVGLPQNYAATDPPGAAASTTGFAVSAAYCYYVDQHNLGPTTDMEAWTALFRVNPRDGVWYLDYELGPVPTDPITGAPAVDPEEWATQPVSQ